jgi:hypothetical protein
MARLNQALYQVALSILLLCCASLAQVAPGSPNFTASDSHTYDSVDLLNNNVVLGVPGMHKAGALPFDFTIFANSAMTVSRGIWSPPMALGANSGGPFSAQVNSMLGQFTPRAYPLSTVITTCPSGTQKGPYETSWVVQDGMGTLHSLGGSRRWGAPCTVTNFTATTIDGSGYTYSTSTATIYDRHGTAYAVATTTPTITDSNGNVIGLSYGVWTDSMGLATVTSNLARAPTYTWTDVNGGSPHIAQSATNLTLATNFGCSSVLDFNNTSTTSMTNGFTLADGRSMAYSYESTYNIAGKYTGRIYQVTFPEGGYARYTYSGGSHGIDCTYQNAPTLTRTLSNGDQTTYTLTHNFISGTEYNAVNAVVDPSGNETDYTFNGFSSTGVLPGGQVLTQVLKYQGHGSAKALLETVYYCYNTAFSACSQSGSAVGPNLPITTVIAFRQLAGMSSWAAAETHFPPPPTPTGIVVYSAQYDFGGSSPVRATTITYGSCTASCNTSSPTISAVGSVQTFMTDRAKWSPRRTAA